MARFYKLPRRLDDIASDKNDQRGKDLIADFWMKTSRKETNKIIITNEQPKKMSRVLMIGAGGVATVAAFKIAQNADVFTEFMIASRRKEKCDQLVKAIHDKGYTMDIKTAQVSARARHKPRIAISGPHHHGGMSGMRMQLSRHCKLRA